MGIDLMTAMKLPKQQPILTAQTTLPQTTNKVEVTTTEKKDIKEILKKNSPYIAGAVLLASLGYYAITHNSKKSKDITNNIVGGNNKIKDNVKDKIDDIVNAVTEKVKDKTDDVAKAVGENVTNKADDVAKAVGEDVANKADDVAKAVGENVANKADDVAKAVGEEATNKPMKSITDKDRILMPPRKPLVNLKEILVPDKKIELKLAENFSKQNKETATQVAKTDVVETAEKTPRLRKVSKKAIQKVVDKFEQRKKALKLNDESIVKKIADNRTKQNDEINRIIGENTRDGKIDINIMRKVANDFAADEKGRGANRLHQSADLLEQTYIKTHIKGDANEKSGLKEFTNALFSDKDLTAVYQKMTLPEVANRINYLKENDLKSVAYKDMSADEFLKIGLKKTINMFKENIKNNQK